MTEMFVVSSTPAVTWNLLNRLAVHTCFIRDRDVRCHYFWSLNRSMTVIGWRISQGVLLESQEFYLSI